MLKLAPKTPTKAVISIFVLFLPFWSAAEPPCHNKGCPCYASDAPNKCDKNGYCIDRNNIKVKTKLSKDKTFDVEVSVDYLLVCGEQGNVLPYDPKQVKIFIEKIDNGKNPEDYGNYPQPKIQDVESYRNRQSLIWLDQDLGDTLHFRTKTPIGLSSATIKKNQKLFLTVLLERPKPTKPDNQGAVAGIKRVFLGF